MNNRRFVKRVAVLISFTTLVGLASAYVCITWGIGSISVAKSITNGTSVKEAIGKIGRPPDEAVGSHKHMELTWEANDGWIHVFVDGEGNVQAVEVIAESRAQVLWRRLKNRFAW